MSFRSWKITGSLHCVIVYEDGILEEYNFLYGGVSIHFQTELIMKYILLCQESEHNAVEHLSFMKIGTGKAIIFLWDQVKLYLQQHPSPWCKHCYGCDCTLSV
jgi:hypothetical protein